MRCAKALLIAWMMLAPAVAGARTIYSEFCNGKLDTQGLPADPRTLATEANGFTSRWVSCHAEPFIATCGDWRAAVAEGRRLLEQDAMVGSLLSAASYDKLWQAWGLSSHPDQASFEARVRERYGLQPAPFDNPYPLPAGGAGQLPMGLIQTRGADGTYDGQIGLTCLACHANRIAGQSIVGLGNSTVDLQAFLQDVLSVGGHASPVAPPVVGGATRGTVDADYGFSVLQAVRDYDTLDPDPIVKAHLLGVRVSDQDPPNWWNKGSRPRALFDGGEPADNTRTFMAFLMADTSASGAEIKAWEKRFEKIYTYIDSIEPPHYPASLPFDAIAAERGKKVFHEFDLFAGAAPVGNGSCSSCHGIHAAEYANDPTVGNEHPVQPLFVSGQIIPQAIVGTDPERLGGEYLGSFGNQYRWEYSTSWWSFVDNRAKDGNPLTEWLNDFNTKEANSVAGGRVEGECRWEQENIGYAAPPLLGLWASAPYFHNGSVPTVWGVLKPEDRPEYWRRRLSSDPLALPEAGFETGLSAYDPAHLGWSYDVVPPTAADPTGIGPDRYVYQAGFGLLGAPWNPVTGSQLEERKIFNTHLFGKSNQGHAYTNALSDRQRQDLIEFLKTL